MYTDTQSSHGFHPCNYEVYIKLKALHRVYWQTLRDFHKWHRWNKKDVKNRKGEEPKYNVLFVENSRWYKGSHVYSKKIIDHGVVNLYHQARMPLTEQPIMFNENTIKLINHWFDMLKE